jgi:Zn-dependent protease with chaperone function
MRAPAILLTAVVSTTLFISGTAAAMDEHSIEGVRSALQSPIPASALQQARQLDDQMLRSGTAMGTKVYLVTDERQQRAQGLVSRVLAGIGESTQGWVVRVFDTDPKIVNAFVNGGKYIYVFTGLLEQVRSDDELAVVVGHEIGHSVLKHNIRRSQDLTTTLANIAAIYGQIKGGNGGANAMAFSKALHSGYSRDDEREADAFGVLAAWHAGFDPLGGAGFFSRLERTNDSASAAQDKQLEDYKAQALAVKAQCETWRAQWASGQAAHTQQNANVINQRCAQYDPARNAYNVAMAQRTATMLQTSTGDHPDDQERVASIAAMTDWLHGARPLKSLQAYPRAYCVIAALVQTKSPIFAGHLKQENATAEAASPAPSVATVAETTPSSPSSDSAPVPSRTAPPSSGGSARPDSPFIKQWNALDDALENGVITKAEYDRKVAVLMAKHRAEQQAAN